SKISAGNKWRDERLKLFNNAHIILLLISPDFLASMDCCQDMDHVLAFPKTRMVRIIPILVRPVQSVGEPFEDLRCLPTNQMPIAEWTNPDKALKDVVDGLFLVVKELRAASQKSSLPPHEETHPDDAELQALITDQSGFMDDRLKSFVGREKELADV